MTQQPICGEIPRIQKFLLILAVGMTISFDILTICFHTGYRFRPLLLFPFSVPAGVYWWVIRAAHQKRPQVPSYMPFVPFGFVIVALACTWQLSSMFPQWDRQFQYQAFWFSSAGLGLFLYHWEVNVRRDFDVSPDTTSGHISLALFTGGSLWWLHTSLQWSIPWVTAYIFRFRTAVISITVSALFLVGYATMVFMLAGKPIGLENQTRGTKLRWFVPHLVSDYGLIMASFASLYWAVSSASHDSFLISNCPSGLTLRQAVYFSAITQTTVGYGDIVPHQDAARLLTAAQAVSGTLLLLLGFGYLLTSAPGIDSLPSASPGSQNLPDPSTSSGTKQGKEV